VHTPTRPARLALTALAAAVSVAGCSSSSTTAKAVNAPTATDAATPAGTSGPDHCPLRTKEDLIEWMRVPTLQDSAIAVGDVDLVHCQPTADTFPQTAPTQAGYCTVLARALDNPGYNANASPALRPRKPLLSVGPAC
jgi:hypothetical protein